MDNLEINLDDTFKNIDIQSGNKYFVLFEL